MLGGVANSTLRLGSESQTTDDVNAYLVQANEPWLPNKAVITVGNSIDSVHLPSKASEIGIRSSQSSQGDPFA